MGVSCPAPERSANWLQTNQRVAMFACTSGAQYWARSPHGRAARCAQTERPQTVALRTSAPGTINKDARLC